MCAKHAAVGQQGVNDLLKRLSSSPALFYLILSISALCSFFLGYSRSPPSRTPADLQHADSGPSSFILNETVSRTSLFDPDESYVKADRKKVNILIGIFVRPHPMFLSMLYSKLSRQTSRRKNHTTTTPQRKDTLNKPSPTPADGESGDYGKRRKAIRETFLPGMQEAAGIEAKFVVGRVDDPKLALASSAEQSRHTSSFLTLDVKDCVGCSSVRACSSCMVEKTIAFYRAAATRFDARWVIKADDDVYLSPLRLPAAAAQWDRMGAEYVGCMKQGVVQNQPDHRWFEPAAVLLGTKYYMHGMGGVYVVAGNVVTDVLAPNAHLLRRLSFEDTTMGMWMLAFNVTYFEDKRVCQPRCHSHAVAFLNSHCHSGCDASQTLRAMHANMLCSRDIPNGGLRYLPSGPGHASFDAMRVLV